MNHDDQRPRAHNVTLQDIRNSHLSSAHQKLIATWYGTVAALESFVRESDVSSSEQTLNCKLIWALMQATPAEARNILNKIHFASFQPSLSGVDLLDLVAKQGISGKLIPANSTYQSVLVYMMTRQPSDIPTAAPNSYPNLVDYGSSGDDDSSAGAGAGAGAGAISSDESDSTEAAYAYLSAEHQARVAEAAREVNDSKAEGAHAPAEGDAILLVFLYFDLVLAKLIHFLFVRRLQWKRPEISSYGGATNG